MKVTTHQPPSFMGVSLGRTKYHLTLNKQELATIRRANAIVEQVRDRLIAELGERWFEGSDWYTLATHDLEDGLPIQWDQLDVGLYDD